MIKQAVSDFLLADPDVEDAIGGRVYNGRVPQHGEYPCVVLEVAATDFHYHLSNESTMQSPVVQVDCFDRDPEAENDTVADLVRNRLSGYTGAFNDDVFCHDAMIENVSQIDDRPRDGSDNWIRRTRMDFKITHRVTAPTHA